MATGIRRQARWYALQVLYACDGAGGTEAAAASYADQFELSIDPRSRDFACGLVARAAEHATAIDSDIQAASRNWRLERMSRVDRNILRLAVSELRHGADVPVRVIINEAIELAKRFGAAESPAFVNGILDRLAQGSRRSAGERDNDDGAGERDNDDGAGERDNDGAGERGNDDGAGDRAKGDGDSERPGMSAPVPPASGDPVGVGDNPSSA